MTILCLHLLSQIRQSLGRDAFKDITLGLFAKKNAHAYNLDHPNNYSGIYGLREVQSFYAMRISHFLILGSQLLHFYSLSLQMRSDIKAM